MEESLIFPSEENNRKKRQAEQYSPLVLAYIGDAVFEVFIRRALVLAADEPVNRLHRKASALVKAEAQSRMIAALEEELTEKEKAVYRRGRNAKSNTAAKNASVTDYRRATGFEALMGYLYLDGQETRMMELMEKAVTAVRKPEAEKERDNHE